MTAETKLVERLLAVVEKGRVDANSIYGDAAVLAYQAADAIERLTAERDALKAVLESLSTPHCILCGCKKHLDDCVIGKALAAQEPKL